jgi:hypothetical protein
MTINFDGVATELDCRIPDTDGSSIRDQKLRVIGLYSQNGNCKVTRITDNIFIN